MMISSVTASRRDDVQQALPELIPGLWMAAHDGEIL